MTRVTMLFDLGVWTRPLAYGTPDDAGMPAKVGRLLNKHDWWYESKEKRWRKQGEADAWLLVSPLGYLVFSGDPRLLDRLELLPGLSLRWDDTRRGMRREATLPDQWEGEVACTLARMALADIDMMAGQPTRNGMDTDCERLILRCKRISYRHPPADQAEFDRLLGLLEERHTVFHRAVLLETRLSGLLSFLDVLADMLFTIAAFLLGAGMITMGFIVILAAALFKTLVTVERAHGAPTG